MTRFAAILGIAATILHVALFSVHTTVSFGKSFVNVGGSEAFQITSGPQAFCGLARFSDASGVLNDEGPDSQGQADRDPNSKGYRCPICLGSVAAACIAPAGFVQLAKLEFEHVLLQPAGRSIFHQDQLRLAPGTIRGPPVA